jgi:protocatechuate 3,4-dioxygenase beta subunit
MKKAALCALTLSLSCLLAAQQRDPLFGTVLGDDGAPIAGATVTIVEDDVDLVGIDPVDVITVTADKRGRFAAQALRGVRYSAFAVGPVVDGRARVGKAVADLACGMQAELLADFTGHARRVQLPSVAAWGERDDLRVRLRWDRCPGHFVDLPIDERGGVDVPAASVTAAAFLVDTSGARLGGVWIPPDPDRGEAVVPERRVVPVEVVDATGQPVVGARVTHIGRESHQDAWGLVVYEHFRGASATTDASGRAGIGVEMWSDPFAQKPDTYVFVAHRAGFGEGASGWLHHEAFVDHEVVERHQQGRLRITMPAASQCEVEPLPAALRGRELRLFAAGYVTQNQGGFNMHHYLFREHAMQVAADGAWTIATPMARSDRFVLRVPPIDGRPVLLLPAATPNVLAEQDRLEPLSVQLRDASGGPAVGAQVLVVPDDPHTLDFEHAVRLVSDQAGRVQALLQQGRWNLIAMTDTEWIATGLEQWPPPEELPLQLQPKPSRVVRVLDGDGAPVPGAKFEPGNFRTGPGGRGIPGILSQLGWNSVGQHVRRAVTDADGRATLRFLPWPGTEVKVFAWRGNFRTRTDDQALAEGDEPLVLRLR